MLTAGFTPHPDRHERVPRRVLLAVVGIAVGLLAAAVAYDLKPSFWLALVVFVLAADVVGRGVGDALEASVPHRVAGIVLPPLAAAAALAGTYALWGRMWLAALIALPLGAAVQQALDGTAPPARLHWAVGRASHDDALARRGLERIRD